VYNSGLEAGRYANSGDICLEHIPNEIGMCFFNATLNFNEALAYITLKAYGNIRSNPLYQSWQEVSD
jgi:hypothetical protein